MGKVGKILVTAAIVVAVVYFTGGLGYTSGTAMANIFGTSSFAHAAVIFVSSAILGFAAEAFAPSLEDYGNVDIFSATGIVRQFQTSVAPWTFIVGEGRRSGPLIYVESTNDNEFLHTIIMISAREMESIDYVMFQEEPIYNDQLDGGGNVIAGSYKDFARIKFHLGEPGQVADVDLVSEVSDWTDEHKLSGRAYIYTRLKYSRDVYPQGVPAISVWGKGNKIFDVRDSSTRWTTNPALIIRDYLVTSKDQGGMGFDSVEDIDDTFITSAANICDESVNTEDVIMEISSVDVSTNTVSFFSEEMNLFQTGDRIQISSDGTVPGGLLEATDYFAVIKKRKQNSVSNPEIAFSDTYLNSLANTSIDLIDEGSGTITVTKNGEPRYTLNGIIDTSKKTGSILESMLTSMAGRASHIGSDWKIYAGAARSPVYEFDENDIVSGLVMQTKHSQSSLFNAIKGTYISPINNSIVTDYPPVLNSTYETQDGDRRLFRELNLPYTSRTHTCQRIAKIELERHRQQITVSATMQLTAFKEQPGGVIQFTNSRFGFLQKEFEVSDMTFLTIEDEEGTPVFGVSWTLREYTDAVFDWSSAEETPVDSAPNTNLPDLKSIDSPTGLILSSGTEVLILTIDGTFIYRIKVEWTPPDEGLLNRYELAWKMSSELFYNTTLFDSPQSEYIINSVEEGKDYDIGLRAINILGVRSDIDDDPSTWSAFISNHTVLGKTQPPADVSSFFINGDVLSWIGPENELDFDGYIIRFNYDENHNFTNAIPLHTGILKDSPYTMDTQPQSVLTLMIKAIDTSGNVSINSKDIVTNLGDPLVANVLEDFPQDPTWPGIKIGCQVEDGILKATGIAIMWDVDDSTLMWDVVDSTLMWQPVEYNPMSYEFVFTPSVISEDSTLTIDYNITGIGTNIEYSVDDPTLLTWPGSVIARLEEYTMKFSIEGGSTQGIATFFTPMVDVPDIEELFSDIVLNAAGTRLILTKSYFSITNITITLQDDGGLAHTAIVQDKDKNLGPLIQAFDITNTGVSGTIDAVVKGF